MSSSVLKHPRKSRPALHGEGVILGVDTHKDVHVAAILTIARVLLATHSFPTTREGYAATLEWAHRFGDVNAAGIECTGSYGFRADEVLPNPKRDSVRVELTRPSTAAQSRENRCR
ncbi:transposase [Cryobacterium sp. M15]|uniref:IS110 family transposase n=1 Tax=Cryobacterium sp. M15 TaxID=2048291 RepID=UPI003513FDB8